jgi:hypothetical protein
VVIGGFVIDGNAPRNVLVRGCGPSMSTPPFLLPGVRANPSLRIFSGQSVIAQNNDWQDSPSCAGFVYGDAMQIRATGLDPCTPNPGQPTPPQGCNLESPILIMLMPGAYTVHLSGIGGGTGIGLIEVIDVDDAKTSKLVNISTRGPVQTGADVMIGGFVIDGSAPKTVMIRGRGPSMSGAPFLIPGVLANPSLRLFPEQAVIAENDDWQDAPFCPALTCDGAAHFRANGLDPYQPNPGQPSSPENCALESAILISLNPGAYTVHLSGADGVTGLGLLEIFQAQD